MKKYIQYTNSADPKIVGVKDGLYQIEVDFQDLSNSCNQDTLDISNYDVQHNHQYQSIELDNIEISGALKKRAILTDVMVFTPYMKSFNYIVSSKFVDILLDANVPSHEFRLVNIEIRNSIDQYYLFHCSQISLNDVIFQDSKIYSIRDSIKSVKPYLSIPSVEDYLNSDEILQFDEVVLPASYQSFSMISIPGISNIFFSEKLAKMIEERNITNFVRAKQVKLSLSKTT